MSLIYNIYHIKYSLTWLLLDIASFYQFPYSITTLLKQPIIQQILIIIFFHYRTIEQIYMTTTFALKTTNLLQISILQNILSQNFTIIANQIDRLSKAQSYFQTLISSKIQTLQNSIQSKKNDHFRKMNSQQKLLNSNDKLIDTENITNGTNSKINSNNIMSQIRNQKERSMQQKDVESFADIQKQLYKIMNMLNNNDSRMQQLEKFIFEGNNDKQNKVNPKIDKQDSKQNEEIKGNLQKFEGPNKKIKKLDEQLKKVNSRLDLVEVKLNSKQKKQKNNKKISTQMSQKIKEPTQKQNKQFKEPGQQSEVQKQEHMTSDSEDQMDQLKKQLNFKINRIDNQNIKILKTIKQLQQEHQKLDESIYSIIQKLKNNQSGIQNQFKQIHKKLQKNPGQKRSRQFNNISKTETSNDDIRNFEQQSQKRIQQILEQIQALKNQVTQIIKEKQYLKQNINNSITTSSSAQQIIVKQKQPNYKKIQNLQHNFSILKKDLNSLRNQINLIISKDQINHNILNQSNGNKKSPVIYGKPMDPKQQYKQLAGKIQKTRAELMTYIKQLQLRLNQREDETELLHQLQSKMHQHKLLINKKADQFQAQRTLKRLQTRLNNFIKQTINQQQYANTHDARIARQPWFCLSCDTQLKNYSGKLGKHASKDQLPGKKINPQNHMVRRSIRDLPQIK